ncbi:hypothetical protein ABKN59_000603 [Abortiporus biennis]
MDTETTDILGGRLPAARSPSYGLFSHFSFLTSFYLVISASLLIWILRTHLLPWYRKRQENNYRKAMRRKHGIPDEDHRPFTVAYAAAKRAQEEREAEMRGHPRRANSIQPQVTIGSATQHRVAPQEAYTSRQRIKNTAYGDTYTSVYPPITNIPAVNSRSTESDVINVAKPHSTKQVHINQSVKHERDDLESDKGTDSKKQKVYEEEDEEEHDVDSESDGEMDVDEDSPIRPQRGSKRLASPEDDEGIESSWEKPRDKRARKVSGPKLDSDDHEMEDVDVVPEMESIPRGKKRDRGEAGSTFGGDDSMIDEEEKPHRHRRRRVVSHRKSNGTIRGQKRAREVVDDSVESESEDSGVSAARTSRQKRGKKMAADGDLSIDDTMLSQDSLCKGRRVGEEWEANGVIYKVGPNGQRLRQALVKKATSRYPMPTDSQHPDRSANINVFVETWLSEEEYSLAKDRHELAWQQDSLSPAPSTPGDVPDSPSKSGKNLLWSSTSHRESPVPRRAAFRQSIATSVGLRLNPFQQAQLPVTRRVTSFHGHPTPTPDSPKLQSSKSYSKWEKQDLEAAAMAKLREKAMKSASPSVTPKPPSATSAPPLFSAPSTQATPSAPAPTASATTYTAPSNLFSKPSAAAETKPASTPDSTTAASAPSAKTSFAPPSTPLFGPSSALKPSAPPEKPAAVPFPSQPSSGQNKPSTFTWGKPPAAPASSSAPATSSSNVPSFFANTQTAAKPAPVPSPAPAPPASQSTAQPKPTFSFGPQPTAPPAGSSPFGSQPAKEQEKKPENASTPGTSLFSRLGGIAPGGDASAAGSSTGSFSFATKAPATTTISNTATTPSNNSGTTSAPAAPPKFDFGFSKPQPPPSTTTAPKTTSAFGPPQSSNDAPKQSAFFSSSFQPSSTTVPSDASKSTSVFGQTPTVDNNKPTFGSTSQPTAPATSAMKPPTSAFGSTASTGSAFSGFGATSATSNGSTFGGGASKDAGNAGATKPAFSFASTPAFGVKAGESTATGGASATSGTTTSTSASKPLFSFAPTSTPATTPAPPSSKPSFSFAPSSTSTTAFGGNSSNFTNAAGPGSTAGAASAPKSNAFSFNFGGQPSGSTATPSTSSPFSFGGTPSNASAPGAASQPKLTAFGFGGATGSSNAFSFGSGSNNAPSQK